MTIIVKMTEPARMGKGVLVTESWDDAIADIKAKVEAGAVVEVSRADG